MVDFLRNRLFWGTCVIFSFFLGAYTAFRLCRALPPFIGIPLGIILVLISPSMFFDRQADEFNWHLPLRKLIPYVSSLFLILVTCTAAADLFGFSIGWAISGRASVIGYFAGGLPPIAAACISCVSCFLVAVGFMNGRKPPALREYHVPLPSLPLRCAGLSIAVVSDTHFLPGGFHERRCSHIVDSVLSAKPDMIVVLGDIAEGEHTLFPHIRRELCRLKAPLGTFFICGNHDVTEKYDWPDVCRSWGFSVLEDESCVVCFKTSSLRIIGLSDRSESACMLYAQE